MILALLAHASLPAATATRSPAGVSTPRPSLVSNATAQATTFDLSTFGAVGDGVADDGPALQSALNAIATAGGGTLIVPAGRYAINTPVQKNFTGLASSLTIQGVESLTPPAPPTANGSQLTHGLDLVSEFVPRTGATQNAITITGLETFLIKDLVFIGTPGVTNDALITLALYDIADATIRHCEFYGLSSLVAGGAIVQAVRSNLTFEQSVVLGSTCSSGVYSSVIQNLEWKSITISEAIFADYGQRPELYGKMNTSPYSWIGIGNAAAVGNESPRREVIVRSVFLDEGGYVGISSLPYRYSPPSAPIDLLYITGLFMNVSNLGTTGHYLTTLENLLVEKSHYGWSSNADSAIQLFNVKKAILDEVECVADANRIRADVQTGTLNVINSIYTHLDSLAQTTNVITTPTPEEDPVQYVRLRFIEVLSREPDAAAHYYWSDQILQCAGAAACINAKQAALTVYLESSPSAKFAVSGKISNPTGGGLAGVVVTLSGSQAVSTTTDSAGNYHFSNLPTSGNYTVTPSLPFHTLTPLSSNIVTPSGDQVFNSTATLNHHAVTGRIADASGAAISGVNVTLSGSQSAVTTSGADGTYSFSNLPAGGTYTVTVQKTSYSCAPPSQTYPGLNANQSRDFTGTLVKFNIAGILAGPNNTPLPGGTITLSGGQSGTTISDSSGNFVFSGLPSGVSYTVTPKLIGLSFTPASRTYSNLSANHYHSYVGAQTNRTISGRVTDAASGAGVSGATVSVSGYISGSVATDGNGNYTFSLAHGGSYTITVSKNHYTFATPSQSFPELVSNQTANFAGTLKRYSIAGRATSGNGSAIAGVTVRISGSQTSTATTDINGSYTFANIPAGGNYTVTPSKTSYTWVPASRVFNDLGSDQTGNFTGTYVTHTISGRVTETGVGLGGVSIALTGSQTSTVLTDSSGNYSFTLPSEGNYTVTPSLQHYTFAPVSLPFNNLAAPQTGNITATRNRHTISGQIVNVNNVGVPGLTVALSGAQAATTTTGATGDFSFANLPAGNNYTVTPSLQYHSFAPASGTYTNLSANQQEFFILTLNTHAINGQLFDTSGVPLAGATVALSGSLGPIRAITTGTDGGYAFGSLPAGTSYTVAVSKAKYSFNPGSRSFTALNSNHIADFTGRPEPFIEFSATEFSVSESAGTLTLTVERGGDTSSESAVIYSATDDTAHQGEDLNSVIGQITFAPGETSKSFTVFITDDAFVEDVEELTVMLGDPQGAILGDRSSARISIHDNDLDSGSASANPVDEAQFFVRQHYRDFLNREPDAAGLDFWSDQIISCGSDAACVEDRRINVSAAFFLSIEFQETGFLVHRLYKASYGQAPRHLEEFLLDTRAIAQDVVVNAPGWQEHLEENKAAFINEFVERAQFTEMYPLNLTPTAFIQLLSGKAGTTLTPGALAAAVAEFGGEPTSADTAARGRVLRSIVEGQAFINRELNPAFVLMQYFGYLQRNPNDLPDTNLDGYTFWLTKLNEFGGDFRKAQMVRSFLISIEYRHRFGL